MIDTYGRPPISEAVKATLAETFAAIPREKRGALLVIADEHGARAMTAAKLGTHWKVGGGVAWDGQVTAQVALMGAW